MIEQIKNFRGGKVIPFEQDGAFFLKRGMLKLDKNNLLDAMVYYRHALNRDPDNAECRLAIAEVLTEMNHFEESNRMLFTFFGEIDAERPSECYFGMGCNFIGLQEYSRARDSFEKYIQVDPQGEFVEEVYDMLDALEDESFRKEMSNKTDDPVSDAIHMANEGKALLERQDFQGAIKRLEGAVGKYPQMNFVRNNLALAYFCDSRYEDAIKQVQTILQDDPRDIQAHCNFAMFCNAVKDTKMLESEVNFILKQQTDDLDDLNRIAVTLMELGYHADSKRILKQLFAELPYDVGTIHRLGVCCYRLGDYMEAISYYDRILKLNGTDSIARYYRGVCRAAAAGGPKRGGLMNNYQVPLDEMFLRISRLNDDLHKPYEELKRMWAGDAEFKSLILWGLDLPELSVKYAMLGLLGMFGDREAERVLRDFALKRVQPDELKQEVFGLLKQIEADEPYLGYIDGQLVQSRVKLIRNLPEDLPESYRLVLAHCLKAMQGVRDKECMLLAVRLWEKYVKRLQGYPRVRGPQIYAMAAALEYLACRGNGVAVSKATLCHDYGVSLVRLNNAAGKLMHVLEECKSLNVGPENEGSKCD